MHKLVFVFIFSISCVSTTSSNDELIKRYNKEDPTSLMPVGFTKHFTDAQMSDILGPIFATVVPTGRLIPHAVSNKIIGFKLVKPSKDSLWTMIQLKHGDIIQSVDGKMIVAASEGMKIYEAFESDREIFLGYLRGGKRRLVQILVE